MDNAVLSIEFKDQSTPSSTGAGATPLGPGLSQQSLADQQLQQIAAQGGAGAKVQAPPPPAAAPVAAPQVAPTAPPAPAIDPSKAPEAALAKDIAAKAPEPTTEDLIARVMGGGAAPTTPATVATTPPTTAPTAPSTAPTVDPALAAIDKENAFLQETLDLVRKERRRKLEAEDEERRALEEDAARKRPPAPPTQAPPLVYGKPPPIVEAPPLPGEGSASQVQSTINAISHFAHMGGPLGSATAGVVNTAVALPGVAQGIGMAAPSLIAAAPYVALAGAVAALPVAVQAMANQSQGMIQDLSPAVASASAQAEVRQLMANIRSARARGETVAENIEQRTNLSTQVQRITDQILPPMLGKLNAAIELSSKAAGGFAGLLETPWVKEAYGFAVEMGTFGVNLNRLKDINKLIDRLTGVDNTQPELIGNVFRDILSTMPEPVLPPPFTNATLKMMGEEEIRKLEVAGL